MVRCKAASMRGVGSWTILREKHFYEHVKIIMIRGRGRHSGRDVRDTADGFAARVDIFDGLPHDRGIDDVVRRL